jgi:hypothetical protein
MCRGARYAEPCIVGLKEGVDAAAAGASTPEAQSQIACRWCGLYSAPGPACELCGSPLLDVPWLQIPQLIGPDGPSGPPPRAVVRREAEPPAWPAEADDDELPPASVSLAPSPVAVEPSAPAAIEPAVEPRVEPAVEPVFEPTPGPVFEPAPEPVFVEAAPIDVRAEAEPVVEPEAAFVTGLPPPPIDVAIDVPLEQVEPQPIEVEPEPKPTGELSPPAIDVAIETRPEPEPEPIASVQPPEVVVEVPAVEVPAARTPPLLPTVDIEPPPAIDAVDVAGPAPEPPVREEPPILGEAVLESELPADVEPQSAIELPAEPEVALRGEPRRRLLKWRKRESEELPTVTEPEPIGPAEPEEDVGGPGAETSQAPETRIDTSIDVESKPVVEEPVPVPAVDVPEPAVAAVELGPAEVEDTTPSPTEAPEAIEAMEASMEPEAADRPPRRPRLGWLARRRDSETRDEASSPEPIGEPWPEPPADLSPVEVVQTPGPISVESDALVEAEPAEPPARVERTPPRPEVATTPPRPAPSPRPRPKPRIPRPAIARPAASTPAPPTPPAPSRPIVERPAAAAPQEQAPPREPLRLDVERLWGPDAPPVSSKAPAPPHSSRTAPPSPPRTAPAPQPTPERAVDLVSAASSILEELSALVASRPDPTPAETPPPRIEPVDHPTPTEPPRVLAPAPDRQPEVESRPLPVERGSARRHPSDADEWTRLPAPRPASESRKDRRGSKLPWRRRKDEATPATDGHVAAPPVLGPPTASPPAAAPPVASSPSITPSPVTPVAAAMPSAAASPLPPPAKAEIACPRCGQASPRGLCEACEDALLQLRQLTAAIYQD